MANGWTPERRARQAEMIRNWRPWEKSTGPRTPEGKSKTASNGDWGGQWKAERAEVRELGRTVRALLCEQRELLRRVLD